ncbi:beta-lactamase [Mariannaea sp. PMI_226]|nr:beta-lactamase [Mariannaea sp. PMI_226]
MEAYERVLEKAVQDGIVPGAIVLAKDNRGKYLFSYSKAVTGSDSSYKIDTVLEIASLTKLVTTIAALQLVERGLIKLDEDVSKYIPVFSSREVIDGEVKSDGTYVSHKRMNSITLHHLLTHTAGAAYTFMSTQIAKYVESAPGYKADGTINSNFDFPISYEPGESWLYGNAIDRVGQIIEHVCVCSLEEYFRQNIFQRLGITTASFFSKAQEPMAVRNPKSGRAIPDPDALTFTTGLKECFGGQGLLMALSDYMKILHSILVDDQVLLKRETAALMFQPQLSAASKAALLRELDCPMWAVGDLPHTGEYDWGYGGLLIDGDQHPYRRRNTLLWSGAPSLFWFIDREAGVCGVFGTQVLPPSDPTVGPLIQGFEEAVYHEIRLSCGIRQDNVL